MYQSRTEEVYAATVCSLPLAVGALASPSARQHRRDRPIPVQSKNERAAIVGKLFNDVRDSVDRFCGGIWPTLLRVAQTDGFFEVGLPSVSSRQAYFVLQQAASSATSPDGLALQLLTLLVTARC